MLIAQPAQAQGRTYYSAAGIEPLELPQLYDENNDEGGSFNYGVGFDVAYLSNLHLSATSGEEIEDYLYSITPWVSYTSAAEGSAKFILNASYSPSYTIHQNQNNADSFSHNANLKLRHNGLGKTSSTLSMSYRQGYSQDRIAAEYVESNSFSGSLSIAYAYSDKTTFTVGSSYRNYSYERERLASSDSYSASFGVNWKASPLVSMGPVFAYSLTNSAEAGDLSSYTAGLNLSYTLSEKIGLSANMGASKRSFSEGASGKGANFTGSLAINYQLDALWSLGLTLSYGAVPAPDLSGSYIDDFTLGLRVNRPLGEGDISLGLSYSDSEYTNVSDGRGQHDKYWSVDMAYSRSVFKEHANLLLDVGYAKNHGREDWDNWQSGIALDFSF